MRDPFPAWSRKNSRLSGHISRGGTLNSKVERNSSVMPQVAFPGVRVLTGLSDGPPLWESLLGMKVEAVQGKQVPLAWTETSGELLVWWHDPGIPLSFPVESTSTGDATGTPGILSRPHRERIPPLELWGGNGAPLDVGGTLVLPLEWRRVCRGTSWFVARVWSTFLKFQRLCVISLEKP